MDPLPTQLKAAKSKPTNKAHLSSPKHLIQTATPLHRLLEDYSYSLCERTTASTTSSDKREAPKTVLETRAFGAILNQPQFRDTHRESTASTAQLTFSICHQSSQFFQQATSENTQISAAKVYSLDCEEGNTS